MTGELAAVVAEQHLRNTTFELQLIQRAHYIVTLQALANFDRHRLSGIDIDDRQRPEARSILQLVRDEVHAPRLIRVRRRDLLLAETSGLASEVSAFQRSRGTIFWMR